MSPCDAIVGATGTIDGTTLYQIKGFPYTLEELLCGTAIWSRPTATAVTSRSGLTSSMYHRFHAPHDCRVDRVTYVSGDTWNVNPIALRRVEKLFCKNERALLRTKLTATGDTPSPWCWLGQCSLPASASNFLDVLLSLKHRGPNVMACDAPFGKGDEMGWFQHGSTVIVLAPASFSLSAAPCGKAKSSRRPAADASAVIKPPRSDLLRAAVAGALPGSIDVRSAFGRSPQST